MSYANRYAAEFTCHRCCTCWSAVIEEEAGAVTLVDDDEALCPECGHEAVDSDQSCDACEELGEGRQAYE